MLLASDYMLNNGGQISPDERPIQISPCLLESRNSHSFRDRVRSIEIPDVDPVQRIEKCFGSVSPPEFSVAAGDFVAIYSHPKETAQWDCVVSCFFLDACPNIIETLNVIGKMLIPGGLLVNLGPLHFHWQGPVARPDDKTIEEYRRRYSHLDDRYLSSIDMSWDDIRQVLINMGYEILKEEAGIECQYTADQRSMMRTTYNCVNFVAR
jgi:carnosine N-methyltransferase